MNVNCCSSQNKLKTTAKGKSSEEGVLKIILAGNPNVGKSVVFNALTGFYVEVSNYPGTTVDISRALIDEVEIIDTPGIYGVGSYNDEEIVAKQIILQADGIVNIVSALSLERDLFLTQQLIDFGFPTVVILNQMDEAVSRGLKIDHVMLEDLLGLKVIPAVAIKNQGIAEVKEIIKSREITDSDKTTPYLDNLFNKSELSKEERLSKLIILEEDLNTRNKIYSERRIKVNEIVAKVVSETEKGISLSAFLGKSLLNPIIGMLAGAGILYLLYEVVGILVAGNAVNYLERNILLKYYSPWITGLISHIIPSGAINEIMVGEFGLLTMTVQYIIGVLLPIVFSFNIFMAILEDSGYLPRLAVLTDNFLSKIGLNGRAVIPIILGFGCITMATITTRILGSKRERTIAAAILSLTIPCSAQFGIIISLIAIAGGLKAWIIYLASIFTILVLIGTVLNKILPGKSTHLLIDIPPMRLPVLKNVMNKTFSKTWHFLEEASPLFFIGAFLITILKITGGLAFLQAALAPITVSMLKLPAQTATVFIMGLIRRDFGAAGLAGMAGIGGTEAVLNPLQILVSLVVITLFVPCIASVVVLYKERGFKEASLIWLASWITAFLAGGILARVLGIFI